MRYRIDFVLAQEVWGKPSPEIHVLPWKESWHESVRGNGVSYSGTWHGSIEVSADNAQKAREKARAILAREELALAPIALCNPGCCQ